MSHTPWRGAAHALALAAVVALGVATSGEAQSTAPAAATPAPAVKVGDQAPDFSLRGATRYGLLAQPVRLADYRGQTVVLAFFFKARTKG